MNKGTKRMVMISMMLGVILIAACMTDPDPSEGANMGPFNFGGPAEDYFEDVATLIDGGSASNAGVNIYLNGTCVSVTDVNRTFFFFVPQGTEGYLTTYIEGYTITRFHLDNINEGFSDAVIFANVNVYVITITGPSEGERLYYCIDDGEFIERSCQFTMEHGRKLVVWATFNNDPGTIKWTGNIGEVNGNTMTFGSVTSDLNIGLELTSADEGDSIFLLPLIFVVMLFLSLYLVNRRTSEEEGQN